METTSSDFFCSSFFSAKKNRNVNTGKIEFLGWKQ